MRSLIVILGVLSLPSCSFQRPPDVNDDGGIDATSSAADAPHADAKLCTANTTSCSNDVLEVCGSDGTVSSTDTCALGCADTTRCFDVDPSNGLAPYLDLAKAQPAVSLLDGTIIDTDTGKVTDAGGGTVTVMTATASQVGGPSMRVLIAGSFTIGNVRVQGTNAVGFVSSGAIHVIGDLDASAHGVAAGPGAPACSSGNGTAGGIHRELGSSYGEPTAPDGYNFHSAGSGGGGFGGLGAMGGADDGDTIGMGGPQNGGATLVPLRGGCAGGAGLVARRGAGGGAVEIVSSTSVEIVAGGGSTGVVDAGGGGGRGAISISTTDNDAATGGGSGGGVLIEAPIVRLSGTGAAIIASGGAGGSGCDGVDGGDARTDGLPATAPACPSYSYLHGGTGGLGAATSAPTAGSAGAYFCGGAGGGALGRIRINTATGDYDAGAGTILRGNSSAGLVTKR